MPEQVFAATARFPSGKTKEIKIKLVNFRGDPDNADDMELAWQHAQKLTPRNVDIQREGFTLIHDNPAEDLKTSGVEDLVKRPAQMQTETTKTQPVERRPTPTTRGE